MVSDAFFETTLSVAAEVDNVQDLTWMKNVL